MQACYVVCDVILFSAAARLALAPRPRPFASWLLAGMAPRVVFSDVAWNWLTISGTYGARIMGRRRVGPRARDPQPGRPASVDAPPRHRRESRRDASLTARGSVLLGVAALISPLMLGLHRVVPAFPNIADSLPSVLAVAIAGAALAALAVMRFLLVMRQGRVLAAALGDALDQRGVRPNSRSRATASSSSRSRARSTSSNWFRSPSRPARCTSLRRSSSSSASPVVQWMRGLDRLLASVHPDDRPGVAAIVEGPAGGRQPEPPMPLRQAQRRGGVGPRRLRRGHDGRRPAPAAGAALRHHRRQARRGRARPPGVELRLAQKLEAVGQLAAGIAHEINTPTQFVGDTVRSSTTPSATHALVDAYERLLVPREAGRCPDGSSPPSARPRSSPTSTTCASAFPAPSSARPTASSASRRSSARCGSSPIRRRPTRRRSTSTRRCAARSSSPQRVQVRRRRRDRPRRAAARPVPRRRDQPGLPQPRRQRGPRDRGRHRRGERGTIRCARRPRTTTSCITSATPAPASRRRRRAHLRPVLHHQGRRARHRPGPRDRPPDRGRAPRRDAHLRDRARPRHHLPRPPAGRRAGQHPRETQVAA